MTRWDGGSNVNAGNAAERGAALRAQAEAEHNYARWRADQMAGRDKSPTGIKRARLKTDEAKSAVGAMNRKLDEALDEVSQAFQREAQAREANATQTAADGKRAPALGNKAVS